MIIKNQNAITDLKIQPGSMLSDLSVYACGLEKGFITLDSIYKDEEILINSWRPANYYMGYKGDMSVKEAIKNNSNIIRIKIIQDMGMDIPYNFLKVIGIESLNDEYDKNISCLAIGGTTNGVKPIEISNAYRTIFTNGTYIEPIFYLKVVDSKDKVYLEKEKVKKNVVKESVCSDLKSAYETNINGKIVYLKNAVTDNSRQHWSSITDKKYTYTTVFFNDEVSKNIESNRDEAYELLLKII